jgi:hypothetical protein
MLIFQPGCAAFPEVSHQPQVHNPFPQLARVAVLPFFNLSDEPTVDGEQVAIAYFSELQSIPGFEVVPVGVVKATMQQLRTNPSDIDDVRKLAAVLNVDAVVKGAITDYDAYYPPRMGLAIDWIAANPGYHPIPAGYGLPWNTAEEEYIPDALVREAEFALAREQLKTQAPAYESPLAMNQPMTKLMTNTKAVATGEGVPATPLVDDAEQGDELPLTWPDPRGFIPPAPSAERPELLPSRKPVLTHIRTYNGADTDFTTALENYYYFRDDARFGGWQGYLQRSDDFIRFCCHQHITEMLTARGGAGQTRVAWRWPISRYEQ